MTSIWNKKKIKLAREESEMLVKDAADALDITPEYLSMLENGHRQPSPKLVLKMSVLYDKAIDYFLDKTENLAIT